jgi:hypothetical protein
MMKSMLCGTIPATGEGGSSAEYEPSRHPRLLCYYQFRETGNNAGL